MYKKCNRKSSVHYSMFYKATKTNRFGAYKTTVKYSKEQFVIVIDIDRTTCIIRALSSGKMNGLYWKGPLYLYHYLLLQFT